MSLDAQSRRIAAEPGRGETSPGGPAPDAAAARPVQPFVWLIFMLVWAAAGLIHPQRTEHALWSMIFIEPRLAQARELARADETEKALQIAQGLLRENPTDSEVLYFVAGLYLELDRPLVAHLYLSALLKSDSYSYLSETQRWRVDTLYGSGPVAEIASNGFIQRQNAEVRHLLDRLPNSWRVDRYTGDVNSLLNAPAWATNAYVNAEYPLACEDGKRVCAFDFSSANIWTAIATQRMTVTDPLGGSTCCSLAIDDPDLRSLDLGYLAFEQERQSNGVPVRGDTREAINATVAFRSNVLLKQLYTLGFINHASYDRPAPAGVGDALIDAVHSIPWIPGYPLYLGAGLIVFFALDTAYLRLRGLIRRRP